MIYRRSYHSDDQFIEEEFEGTAEEVVASSKDVNAVGYTFNRGKKTGKAPQRESCEECQGDIIGNKRCFGCKHFEQIRTIKIIRESDNGKNMHDDVYGVYSVVYNKKREIFIKNGNSICAVRHVIGAPATDCLMEVEGSVMEEFMRALKNRTDKERQNKVHEVVVEG